MLASRLLLAALSAAALLVRATPTDAPAAPASALAWTPAAESLPVARDHHVTFVVQAAGGDFLYVAGGNTYRALLDDVWRARIGGDGALGAWERMVPLPAVRGGHAVAVTADAVVLTAGQSAGGAHTTDVLVARVNADGTLGAWAAGPPLPGARFHHASVVAGGHLYVLGGMEGREAAATVFRSRLGAGGSLGAWEALPALPRPRSHHAAVVHGGAIYLVAGQEGNPAAAPTPFRDVLRATVGADGALGAWTPLAATLDSTYATHAAAVAGGHLYLLGGVESNARFVDVVQRAPLRADGSLGPWARVAPGLPTARSHVHQTPVLRDRIYSVGGSNRRVVSGGAWVGKL